ncbi:flippase [Planktothrix sp. FACHB-1355]|uniref:Flippase n=1 Tax=Aerosakkonema funiforme FACHB-1375 TaxID=2949571 RepID=A0A926V9V4_9CYAN|nr:MULTISPECIES: flippase [Oscillatoriales]MBD2179956.1 flippase [Aerosakkonema funiforme FACHB-1375]MBD3559827.1 flippase [Planktothrix sp. FACHB-1355]
MLNKLKAAIAKLSPELRRIIGSVIWLSGDRILRMGVGLIVTAWIARYLGPDGFGLFNFATAFVSLFGVLATLGLNQIVVRDIVRDPSLKDETLGTTFVLKLAGGILTVLISSGAISLVRPHDRLTLWIVAITASVTIFDAFNTIDLWFQSLVKSKHTVIAKNIAFVIVTALRIALIEMKAPVVAFAWVLVVESALGSIGLAIAHKLDGQNLLRWRPKFQRAKTLLKESWPLIISDLAIMIYVRIDQIMLGQLMGDKPVGIYSAAVRIAEVWYFFASAIVNSVTPAIVQAKQESETLYYNKLQKLFNLMVIVTFSIAIPLTLISKFLIVAIFGQKYAAAASVLSIYIWSAVFGFFGWAKGIWIVAEGQTVFALISTCCGATMNIILNFWLIPLYQENGAALASVISYSFTDYVMCLIYPPARKLGWIMTNALTFNLFARRSRE